MIYSCTHGNVYNNVDLCIFFLILLLSRSKPSISNFLKTDYLNLSCKLIASGFDFFPLIRLTACHLGTLNHQTFWAWLRDMELHTVGKTYSFNN